MTPAGLQTSIIDFALAQVGKDYDYEGITGFITGQNNDNVEKWFCSELVSAAFAVAGVPLLRNDPYKISPGGLATSPLLSLHAMIYTAPDMGVPQYIPGNDIRVALYRGTSAISVCIQFHTRSPYSHAALILPDHTVIEALPRGVVHHDNIAEFHNAETATEIWQPNWPAIMAAWPTPLSNWPTLQDAPGLTGPETLTETRPAAASRFAQGFRHFAQGIREGMPGRGFAAV